MFLVTGCWSLKEEFVFPVRKLPNIMKQVTSDEKPATFSILRQITE